MSKHQYLLQAAVSDCDAVIRLTAGYSLVHALTLRGCQKAELGDYEVRLASAAGLRVRAMSGMSCSVVHCLICMAHDQMRFEIPCWCAMSHCCLTCDASMSLLAQAALADLSAAVAIDPAYSKALQTRGTLQLQLGRLQVLVCTIVACCGSFSVPRPCKLL